MTLDQPVPDFTAISTGATAFRLSAQAGRGLVLYFYPKDDTPGCTTETAAFRDHHAPSRRSPGTSSAYRAIV